MLLEVFQRQFNIKMVVIGGRSGWLFGNSGNQHKAANAANAAKSAQCTSQSPPFPRKKCSFLFGILFVKWKLSAMRNCHILLPERATMTTILDINHTEIDNGNSYDRFLSLKKKKKRLFIRYQSNVPFIIVNFYDS